MGWLSRCLHGEANLGYSFSKSLGGGTISLFGFILASPFNLMSFFFEPKDMPKFFTILYLCKLSTAGVTCLCYIRNRFPALGMHGVLFAAAYALMLSNFSSGSNVMWLDGVYMLPLVLLGVYRLVQSRARALLFVSVALMTIFNWYSSYISCLTSVLFFFIEIFLQKKKPKQFLYLGFDYAVTMILALLASMVLFYPVIKYMSNSSAISGSGSTMGTLTAFSEFSMSPLDYIGTYYFANTMYSPWGNMPISGIVLLFSASLLFIDTISLRVKLLFVACLLFSYISCAWTPFATVWTGLVRADSFMPRYSYSINFILILFSCFALNGHLAKRRSLRYYLIHFGISSIIIALLFVICSKFGVINIGIQLFFQVSAIVIFGILSAILLINSQYYRHITRGSSLCVNHILPSLFCCILLGLLFVVEQSYEIKKNGMEDLTGPRISVSNYSNYIDNLSQQQASWQDGSFFRTEKYTFSSVSDSYISLPSGDNLASGLHSLSHYSSATQQPVNTLLGNLGYCLTPGTRAITYYNSPMLLTDTIFGIRYVYGQAVPPFGLEQIGDSGLPLETKASVYRNSDAFSIGFSVPKDIADTSWESNPFKNQNSWASSLLGAEIEPYRMLDVAVIDSVQCQIDHSSIPKSVVLTNEDAVHSFLIKVTEDGPVYIFPKSSEYSAVFINGVFKQTTGNWEFDTNAIQLGDYEKDDVIEVSVIPLSGNLDASVEIFSSQLDKSVYSSFVDVFQNRQLKVDKFSDGYIAGHISVGQDCRLMLTIPIEDGWTIKINGRDVEAAGVDGLMCVPLVVGDNEVELKYCIPGLRTGFVLCLVGIFGFAAFNLFMNRGVRRKDHYES